MIKIVPKFAVHGQPKFFNPFWFWLSVHVYYSVKNKEKKDMSSLCLQTISFENVVFKNKCSGFNIILFIQYVEVFSYKFFISYVHPSYVHMWLIGYYAFLHLSLLISFLIEFKFIYYMIFSILLFCVAYLGV